MKSILRFGVLVTMMFALIGPGPAHAIFGQIGSASGCKAAKAKCVTKMKACMLGCYNKSIGKGVPVDQACLDKCRNGFYGDPAIGKGCNEKAEAKGPDCGASANDGPVVRSKVEAHVLDLMSQMVPGGGNPLNKCTAGKMKCVLKYNSCVLGIVGKAFKAGTTVGALDKCNAILTNNYLGNGKDSCVGKLETKYGAGCLTTGDQGVLKSGDDAFVNDIIYGMVGAGDLASKRCTCDTSVQCSTSADCPGACPCEFYFGSPLPLSAGGVTTCVTSQWAGGMSGTFNQQTGASAGTASLTSRVYNGIALAQPCPTCAGLDIPNDGVQSGTCSGGVRNGLACDGGGESPIPAFGVTSLDCPPTPGGLIATLPIDLTNTNAPAGVTKTLSASSPNCNGSPGDKCLCASCSHNSSIPCASDADCGMGNTCTNTAGEPRKPNSCVDDTATAEDGSVCTATAGGEGACLDNIDQNCAIQTYKGCTSDSECNATLTGDICLTKNRECFPGYNGVVGESITATGGFQPPHNHTGSATFASVFCVAPTGSSSVNSVAGLPGPGRLGLQGVSSEDGTDVACPTKATFLPTAKGGVLDTGWTGISHDAKVVGQGKVTVSVTGCSTPPPACGTCTYTGPVAN